MKKYQIVVSILIILNLAGVVSIIYFYNNGINKEKVFKKVSVILNSDTTEHWYNLKQGMNQAASDNDIELNFVVLSGEDRHKEQSELINREINNGANAILIIPTKGEELAETVTLSKTKVPIISLLSGTTGETQSFCVKANNFQMGYDLGKELVERSYESKNIAIIMRDTQSNYIEERREGFMSAVINSQYNIKIFESLDKDIELDKYGVAVSFDAVDLEYMLALISAETSTKIFGIGSTNTIVAALDKGLIDCLLVENEYNIGYIGVEYTTEHAKKNSTFAGDLIEYDIVNINNMYDKKNQRLLFPLVQ